MNKKIILVCMLILSTVLYSGCIYDKTASIDYDEETLVMEGDKLGLNKDFVVEENEGMQITAFDFNGTYTIWEYNSGGETLSLDYSSELNSGNLKLILIDPKNNITEILVQNVDGKIITGNKSFKLTTGNYRMKLVGKHNAAGVIKMKVNYGLVTGSKQ